MRKLSRSDVKDIAKYEKVRQRFRARIIEIKKGRRISVGPLLTFVFENRDTVLFQIQEMMRAERIVHEKAIAYEIETYNALIPDEHELSATMLIEITEAGRIRPVLQRLMGIDRGERVWLQFGDERVAGVFEEGRSTDTQLSAVHFIRFKFTPRQSRRFRSGEDAVSLVVGHPSYRRTARLPAEVAQSLASDLET